MKTVAIIPVKNLGQAKSRLAPSLALADRQALCLAMLLDMLTCLQGVKEIHQTCLVCADPAVHAALGRAFPRVRLLNRACSLNEAAAYAMGLLRDEGVGRMLLLHGDLPLISEAAITAALQAAPLPGVLLLADKAGIGTNGMVTAPPDILDHTVFGQNSLSLHEKLCKSQGIPVRIFRNEATSLDIDQGADILRLADSGGALRSAVLLRKLAQAEQEVEKTGS